VAVASISQMLPSLALADDTPRAFDELPNAGDGNGTSPAGDALDTTKPTEEQSSEPGTETPDEPTPPNGTSDDDTSGKQEEQGEQNEQDEQDEGEGEPSTDSEIAKDAETTDNTDEAEGELSPLSSEQLVPEGIYLIRSALAHTQVLDIAGGSKHAQANVQLYTSNMTGAQSFALSYDENGYATFINTQSGKALDVMWGKKRSGANIWQYTPNNTPAQKWVIEPARVGAGYVLRSALAENLVLDVAAAQTANGTNVQLYTRNDTRAQSFFFISLTDAYMPQSPLTLAPGDYVITSALSGSPAVDIPGAAHTSGLQLQLYTPNGTLAQMFRVGFDGSYYTLRSLASAKSVAVAGNNRVATTAAVQENHNPRLLSQKWALEDNGDGTVTFISASCGLALDATGGKSTSGTRLQLYTPNGTTAQRFRLTPAPALVIPDKAIISLIPYAATSMRIDIASASRRSGALAQAHASNGTLAQKFEVTYWDSGALSLSALCSGQLLTIEGNTVCQRPLASSTPLPSQLWKAERAPGGMTLTNQADGRRLALSGTTLVGAAAAEPGAAAADALAQCFTFGIVPAITPGTYVLTTRDGFVLDIASASVKDGANVQLYAPNNTNAQKFTVATAGGTTVSIRNCHSEKAVSVKDSSSSNGTNVLQQTYQSSANQRFTLVPDGAGYFRIRSALSPATYLGADRGASGANVYSTTDVTRALSFGYRETTYTRAEKWIAITFDDGPSSYTEHLLDELKKRDAHATFFIVGSLAQSTRAQSLLKRMHNEGHEIGNHTWAHDGTAGVLMGALQATDDVVQKATGKPTALMRPPGGNINAQTYACGKPIILWSIDPRDWENRNGTYIYNHIVGNAKSGDIILLHDSHNTTIPAALRVIDTLKSRGYAFVTVSQLLGNAKANTVYRSGPSKVGVF
jgi:peptidoglycan/xylan/chitin deacetylase (PgdA/CDA1 family)